MRERLRYARWAIVVLLFWLPSVVTAQEFVPAQIPGFLTTQERVKQALAQPTTESGLLQLLRRLVVCVSSRQLFERLGARDVRVVLINQNNLAEAIRLRECNLFISGEAARRLNIMYAPPDDVGDVNVPPPEIDNEGPVIQFRQNEFTGTTGAVQIQAAITDPSGVARAVIEGPDGVRPMANSSGRVYQVQFPLPGDYLQQSLIVRARDGRGNESEAKTVVRRLPACGRSEGVNVDLVKRVQEDLNTLGRAAGQVDGLAGPGTCRAIAEYGFGESFEWPVLAGQLALDRITLDAPDRVEGPEARIPVSVTVSDPRRTGAVRRVEMLRGGRVAAFRDVQSGLARFDVALNEGTREILEFRAVDARNRVLARDKTQVARSAPVQLNISADGLSDGRLSSEESSVVLRVAISGLAAGQVGYRSTGGQGDVADFRGRPVEFEVAMPLPGQSHTLQFVALDSQRNTRDTREIILMRQKVTISIAPAPVLELDEGTGQLSVLLIGARVGTRLEVQGPDGQVLDRGRHRPNQSWTARVKMPKPGGRENVVAVAFDSFGAELVRSQPVTLVRPAAQLPTWVIPAVVGFILLTGLISGLVSVVRKGFRRRPSKTPTPTVRVVSVPDSAPEVEIWPELVPSFTLRVEPGDPAEPEIVFDEKEDGDGT